MNIWMDAGTGVATALLPCADMCLRGDAERRLVGMEVASFVIVIAMILFSIGFGRLPFIDLPLALAIMSFGGTLVFIRFLGKHL